MARLFDRVLDRWSPETQERKELRGRSAAAHCRPVDEQPDREVVRVHGVIRAVTLRPTGPAMALQAELYDGTGSVLLLWLGRRRITGIDPGRGITVTGRLGRRDGERVIYNPRYELDPV